jgi:hypothetical protein
MNFRPGPESSEALARRDFKAAPAMPMASARTHSASQTPSRQPGSIRCPATQAAASAVIPISAPPIPGTAVNDPARSMTRRM